MKQNDFYLIKNADEYQEINDIFVNEFFIKRDNVLYDGFWGKNGFNSIEVVFKLNDKYYKTPRYCTDVLSLNFNNDINVNVDCPHECSHIRLFLWRDDYWFKLKVGLSNIGIEIVKKG